MYLQQSKKKKKQRGQSKVKMPLCEYGKACNRPGCVYRHPPKSATEESSAAVCVPSLTNDCIFGSKCRNRHPNEAEKQQLIAKYRSTPCRFGLNCHSVKCLYMHPERPTEETKPSIIYMEPTPLSSLVQGNQQEQNTFENHFPTPQQNSKPPELSANAPVFIPSFGVQSTTQYNPPVSPPKSNVTMAERIGSAISSLRIQENPPMAPQHQNTPTKSIPSVRLPAEIWVDSVKRNPAHYSIVDPITRFEAVNEHSVPGVVDLHFQTASTVAIVLDRILPYSPFYYPDELNPRKGQAWVVTGTGHHTKQRLHKLSDIVEDYLVNHGYTYSYGKNGSGARGAFLVTIER